MERKSLLGKMFQDIVSISNPLSQFGGREKNDRKYERLRGGTEKKVVDDHGEEDPVDEGDIKLEQKEDTSKEPKEPKEGEEGKEAATKEGAEEKAKDKEEEEEDKEEEEEDKEEEEEEEAPSKASAVLSSLMNKASEQKSEITYTPKTLSEPQVLFKRVFMLTFMFCLAVYLASITFRSSKILKRVFKLGIGKNGEPQIDMDFLVDDGRRWRRCIQGVFVLCLLALTYFIVLMIILFMMVCIYISVFTDEDEILKSAMETYVDLVFKCKIGGAEHNLWYVYAFMLIVLFCSFFVYFIYFLMVKGYFQNIAYPNYVPAATKGRKLQKEFTNPTKFAFFHGIYLIIMFMFIIILLSFYNLNENAKFLSTCIFVLVTCMMFIMLIYRYSLERCAWKINVLWFTFLAWIGIVYFTFS